MTDLVESLGSGYFRDFFNGAIFLYQGKAHSVMSADTRTVTANRLWDGETVNVPNREFMGFKAFAYPTLGYRRFSEDAVGWLSRIQSVHRGLRERSISTEYSPASIRLWQNGLRISPASNNVRAGRLAFEPTWDSAADITKLLAGEQTSVVLNESLMLEPSAYANNDWYAIYYNQAAVGSMDYRGRCTFKSTRYEKLIVPMLKAA